MAMLPPSTTLLIGSAPRNVSLLLRDAHAAPECNVVPDVLRAFQRRRIKPSRILVRLAADHYVIVIGLALPRADRVRRAVLKKLAHYALRRKILIPFHFNRVVAFGQHRTFPRCFRHVVWMTGRPD